MLTDTSINDKVKTTSRLGRSLAIALLVVSGSILSLAAAQAPVTELRNLVEQDPGNAAAWTELGNVYLSQADYENAKNAFLEAVSLDYRQGDAHYGLGLAEYNRGDYQAALFSFSEVARQFPERFDGHYNLAVTQARLRMPAEAAASFQAALDNAAPEASLDDQFSAWQGLASQLKLVDDFAGAAAAYEEAVVIEPDNRDVRYLHAEALYRAGSGLDALPLLTELDDEGNQDYRVSSLIADIYLEQGQIDYALRALDRAIRKAEAGGSASVQAGVHIKLGLLLRDLGRTDDALESFQRATSIDPASWQAHYNLGLSYLEAGRTQEALNPLETAVVREPTSGEARVALAAAFDQAGDAAAALEQANSALGLLADAGLLNQARFLAGRSEYRLGNHAQAAALLDQVVSERPGDAQAQLWAGLAHYQLADYDLAIQYYERAVQLAPESREARANLAAAYLAAGYFSDAEFVYLDLLEVQPADAQSHYNLGWALLSQNRLTAARDSFEAALELGHPAAGDALNEYF